MDNAIKSRQLNEDMVASRDPTLSTQSENARKTGQTGAVSSGGNVSDALCGDIVADSYNIATRQSFSPKKVKQYFKEEKGSVDANNDILGGKLQPKQDESCKNYVQLENCDLQNICPNTSQQHVQGEFLTDNGTSFIVQNPMWRDAGYVQKGALVDRYNIPNQVSPTYLQPHGMMFAKPMQIHGMQQHEIMQPAMNNMGMGYTLVKQMPASGIITGQFEAHDGSGLQAIPNMQTYRIAPDQSCLIPQDMRPAESFHPILLEGDETLECEEERNEENEESGKRKQNKRPKKVKKPKIKRPMNAFMVWAKRNRPVLAKNFPGMTNADVSVMLGEKWSSMKFEEKQPFFEEADRIKNQHKKDFPDWAYQPKPKRHRYGQNGKSFFFEVTKNTQGSYVTRHINDHVMQQMPSQNVQSCSMIGKQQVKASGVQLVRAPAIHNEAQNFNMNAGIPQGMCVGSVRFPPNMISSGSVLVAQTSPSPTYQMQTTAATMQHQINNFNQVPTAMIPQQHLVACSADEQFLQFEQKHHTPMKSGKLSKPKVEQHQMKESEAFKK